jgi:hypothetical protein
MVGEGKVAELVAGADLLRRWVSSALGKLRREI